MKKKSNKKRFWVKHYAIVCTFLLVGIFFLLFLLVFKFIQVPGQDVFSIFRFDYSKNRLLYKYNECLNSNINLEDNEKINDFENSLNKILKSYRVSVLFKGVNDSYTYIYNEKENYYAASTIKVLDAIYIYNKANKGEIDLSTEVTYTKNYSYADSKGMEKHKFGDKVSLRELVSYAIMYSDNAAHRMLVDYIGLNNLREFSKEIGAKFYLTPNELFGTMTVNNALCYLQELYRLISINNENGKELYSFFTNSISNFLSIDVLGIPAAVKFGYYDTTFHNIGIVYAEDPYYLIVLTKEGHRDYENIIKTINNKIYELYVMKNNEKKDICYERVYGVQNREQ